MNMVLSLDNKTTDELANLAPHKNIINLDVPRTLTDAARIPKPVASTISNWIHGACEFKRSKEEDAFINMLV